MDRQEDERFQERRPRGGQDEGFQDRPPRRREDDDFDEPPPRGRRAHSGVPCPSCGSRWLRAGPWPWYLGTVGAMLCRAVICNECGHEFDANKPHANLASRKRNLAIIINLVGLLGIISVVGGLAWWIWWNMKPE
jgi:hypothetical protein